MTEETYDDGRAKKLEAMLRDLAERIRDMDRDERLLENAAELLKLFGDIRSELFHYEVRATYDTPEIAENRRIVRESTESEPIQWEKTEWKPDEEDDPK
ncbi:MAG TPA: hypothetical protein VLE53_05875 [Gemmatimonadaceae bacterium]|nr:hypothetical protein [Gemmatimonadaceae bacterium]